MAMLLRREGMKRLFLLVGLCLMLSLVVAPAPGNTSSQEQYEDTSEEFEDLDELESTNVSPSEEQYEDDEDLFEYTTEDEEESLDTSDTPDSTEYTEDESDSPDSSLESDTSDETFESDEITSGSDETDDSSEIDPTKDELVPNEDIPNEDDETPVEPGDRVEIVVDDHVYLITLISCDGAGYCTYELPTGKEIRVTVYDYDGDGIFTFYECQRSFYDYYEMHPHIVLGPYVDTVSNYYFSNRFWHCNDIGEIYIGKTYIPGSKIATKMTKNLPDTGGFPLIPVGLALLGGVVLTRAVRRRR